MMSLYAWLLIATIAGPLLLSFDQKVAFHKSFIPVLLATFPVALIFLIWDVLFTQWGIWGFNPDYLSGIYLLNLPLEEVLFFFIVPFACIFIFEVVKAWLPQWNKPLLARFFSFGFTLLSFTFGLFHLDNAYTGTACILAALLTIGLVQVVRIKWYATFAGAYLLAIIPFLIVNGILTGACTSEPIVWYNEEHIMGPRIYTIPVEDLFYNYDLLLPITGIFEYLKNKRQRK